MSIGSSSRDCVDVDADAEHDAALGGLREDARDLASADEHVVRMLHRRLEPGLRSDRLRNRGAGDERELRQALARDLRLEHDREQQARSGGRVPRATEPPASLRLLVGRDDGALARAVEQPLGGRTTIDERVWTAEAAAQLRNHVHRAYTRRA